MKRTIMLWTLVSILGVWAGEANTLRAATASETPKDKTAKEIDDGGLDVDWGDDEKNKDKSETQPADKEKSATDDSAGDKKDKDGDAKKEGEDDGGKSGDEGKKEKEVVVLDSLEGFYSDLAKTVEMPEDQQKALEQIQEKMKKHVEMQEKKDKTLVEHLQNKIAKADDVKRQTKYQKELDEVQGRLKLLENSYHAKALKTLKGDQIQKWNVSLIWLQIEPDLNMLSISDEQRDKAQKSCDEFATKYKSKPLPEDAGAKLKMQVAKKMLKDVLNAEQGKEYKRFLTDQLKAEKEAKEATKGGKTTQGGSKK